MIGEKLIRYKNACIAAITALIIGILTHMFALTNVLHNYDSINASFHGFGVGVESGRWLLTFLSIVIHKFLGGYNLPWFNGVIAIILLSVSAAVIVEAFQIRKSTSAILIGLIFMVFPTVSSTLFFRYVCLYDAFAIMLAVFAAYLMKYEQRGLLICSVCTAMSMGIYQAYFPITVTMLLIMLLQFSFKGASFFAIVRKGLYYLLSLLLGLAVYFAAQRITQWYFGATLLDYQGISQMGSLSLRTIPKLVMNAYHIFLTFYATDYCDLAPNILAKIAIPVVWCISVIAICLILIIKKSNLLQWLTTGIVLLMLPIAICLIEIMAMNSKVYTLMVYSFVFVYIFPVVVTEELSLVLIDQPPNYLRRFSALSICAVYCFLLCASANYIYLDNVNYTSMYYTTKQTENYMNALVIQVRMTEGYKTSQQWAFIGESIQDPLLAYEWANTPHYGGNDKSYINAYSRNRWINTYFGYDIPLADENTVLKLSESDIVKTMECFPNEGSIRIIDDVVVIKLENP